MNSQIDYKKDRYEIVLLEDDPDTLKLLNDKLEARGITVHSYDRGDEALQKILDDSNIGALVTDIEIKYPYPDGKRDGMQGFHVANRIFKESPTRLLSVIALSQLDKKEGFESPNKFMGRYISFSKWNWIELDNQAEREKIFDALALLVKECIELTPYKWQDEVNKLYPKSRWVCEYKKGGKINQPYWNIYRELWFSDSWKTTEPRIGEKAHEIVTSYLNGEYRQLRGDHLSLTENPNEITFQEHLIGRRVIYALKALEPAYWKNMIRGEKKEEENPSLDPETWEGIHSDDLRTLTNKLMAYTAEHKLVEKHSDLQEILHKVEILEKSSKRDSNEYNNLLIKQNKLQNELKTAKNAMQTVVKQLSEALDKENDKVQQGFIPYLRFWNLDFTEVDWVKKTKLDDQGPIKQMLLLLGIREEDIRDDYPENWKLLLPEERKWLKSILEKN